MPVLDRRSDTVKQQDPLTAARTDLRLALATLQAEAKSVWRTLDQTDHPDLTGVYSAAQAVKDAEEGVTYTTRGRAA